MFVYSAGKNLHDRWCGAEVVTSNIIRMNPLSLGKSL